VAVYILDTGPPYMWVYGKYKAIAVFG